MINTFTGLLGKAMPAAGTVVKLNTVDVPDGEIASVTIRIVNTENDEKAEIALARIWVSKASTSSNVEDIDITLPNYMLVPRSSLEDSFLLTANENIWVTSTTGTVVFRATAFVDQVNLYEPN
jgi:hypothetical protein